MCVCVPFLVVSSSENARTYRYRTRYLAWFLRGHAVQEFDTSADKIYHTIEASRVIKRGKAGEHISPDYSLSFARISMRLFIVGRDDVK